jgi:hypothetical protein
MMFLGGLLVGLGLVSWGDDPPEGSLPAAATRKIDFDRDVRPIFAGSCLNCHGPKKRKGGLALHLKAGALAGGDDGPVILPGKSLESRLLRYVAGLDDEHQMPPEGSGDPLKPEQVGVLRAWIEQGASWPDDSTSTASEIYDHWAFRRPIRHQSPDVHDPAWSRNPIDRFVMARLDREGLKPSPEADRATMIRRLSLDLIGLPPTIAEAPSSTTPAMMPTSGSSIASWPRLITASGGPADGSTVLDMPIPTATRRTANARSGPIAIGSSTP